MKRSTLGAKCRANHKIKAMDALMLAKQSTKQKDLI